MHKSTLSKLFMFRYCLVLATTCNAHMVMNVPTPYGKSSLNNSPLNGDGSDYPCKQRGGVYNAEGANNIMELGSTQQLSFKGSAVHGGGSCQVSITYDMNPTKHSVFKVIHSIIGGCPARDVDGNLPSDPNGTGSGRYYFEIPKDLVLGNATLAWTWFNKIGNREMFMNCAPITLIASRGASGGSPTTLSALPDMFIANIGNGCITVANKDVDFPNPGQRPAKFGSSPPSPPLGPCSSENSYRNTISFGDVSSAWPSASTSAARVGPRVEFSSLLIAGVHGPSSEPSVTDSSIASHTTRRFPPAGTSMSTAVIRTESKSASPSLGTSPCSP